MGLRTIDLTVEIDMRDIDTDDLIAELAARGIDADDDAPPDIDPEEIETAREEILRGRRDEALIHIERALGGDFVGRLAI